MGCFKVIVSLTKVSSQGHPYVTTGRTIQQAPAIPKGIFRQTLFRGLNLGFDSLREHHSFSSLDPDPYLCWFLQVLESQVLHDEIMYVLCHLRVLEPPVFASLHRV